MKDRLDIQISRQPDETTCGPTCLHAVYRFYGDGISLHEVIEEVPQFEDGGTLAVMLGCHALKRGYRATIYSYNLKVFDPSWFELESVPMRERLIAQLAHKQEAKLQMAVGAYARFLELGGDVRFEDLTRGLLRGYLNRGRPLLTGLSATWLYRCRREKGNPARSDDLAGYPTGHFVVLCGYDPESKSVLVADPLLPNPVSDRHYYAVTIDRLVSAILLGILTYDANLLIIEPAKE